MRSPLAMGGAVLLGLLTSATAFGADEQKISADKLPAAVKKAVGRKFPDAKIRAAAKEVEGGKTTYEVMLTDEGHSIDVALKADGTILEVEREIAVSKLPNAVARTLSKKYPGAKIERAEALIRGEEGPTTYEVVVGGNEIVLTAKGQIIEPTSPGEAGEKSSAKGTGKTEKEEDDD